MYNSLLNRTIAVTAQFLPLSATRETVAKATLQAPVGNAAVVTIKSDNGGTDTVLAPGDWYPIDGVNLADVKVKGTVPDTVVVVGSSTKMEM